MVRYHRAVQTPTEIDRTRPDPQAVAHQFMELLRDLGTDRREEVAALEQALVSAIRSFDEQPDKAVAGAELSMRLRAVEASIAKLAIARVRRIGKRLHGQAKRVGRSSKEGRAVHDVVATLKELSGALEALSEAAATQDEERREAAHAKLLKAQSRMDRVKERYGEL